MSHPQQSSAQHHHAQMGAPPQLPADQHAAMLPGMAASGGHPYPGMHPGVPMQNYSGTQGPMQPGVGHLGQYAGPQHMNMQGMMPAGHALGQGGMPMPGYGRGVDGAPGAGGGHPGHASGPGGMPGQPTAVLGMPQMNHLPMGAGMHPYQGMPPHGLPLSAGLVGVGHSGPPVHGQMPESMIMQQEGDMGVAGGSSSRRPGHYEAHNSAEGGAPRPPATPNENSGGSRQGQGSAAGANSGPQQPEGTDAAGEGAAEADSVQKGAADGAAGGSGARNGKKQRGGGTIAAKKKVDKDAEKIKKRDEKSAREHQKQEEKERKQKQRDEKRRQAQLQKRNQKSVNSKNKSGGPMEGMGGAPANGSAGEQNAENEETVKRSQAGEMEQPQDVQESLLQADQKAPGQKDGAVADAAGQAQNQSSSKNAQGPAGHGSSLAPPQASAQFAEGASGGGRGQDMEGPLMQPGANPGSKTEAQRGLNLQMVNGPGQGPNQGFGELGNGGSRAAEMGGIQGGSEANSAALQGRSQSSRAQYGHDGQPNQGGGRSSHQQLDDASHPLKGPRGDEIPSNSAREAQFRGDNAQRQHGPSDNGGDGAAKNDESGRGQTDNRSALQQPDAHDGGRQRQPRSARQQYGQANPSAAGEGGGNGKEATEGAQNQPGYQQHASGQGAHPNHQGQPHGQNAQGTQAQQYQGQGMPAGQMGHAGANGKGALDPSQLSLQQQMLYMNASAANHVHQQLYHLYHLNQLQGGMPGGLQHNAAAAQAALGNFYHVQQNAHAGQVQAQQMHTGLMQGAAAAGAMGHPIMGPQGMPGPGIPGMHAMPAGLYPNYGLSAQQLLAFQGRGNGGVGQGPVHDSRNNMNSYSVYGGGAGAGGAGGTGGGNHGNPSNTNGGQTAYYGGQDKKDAQREQQFDDQLRKTLGELKVTDDVEIEGVKLKMPHMNVAAVTGYDLFLRNESPKKILRFLRKTLYNTRQIKKTLDLRKFARMQLTGQLDRWKEQPDRIIRQKMNPRMLKLKAKRRAERQRFQETGEQPKKYECPVYLCKAKYHTEDELLEHYNEAHADLVELGLRLRRSKKSKREQQRQKEEAEVEQIHLDGQARNRDKKRTGEQAGADASLANKEGTDASSGVSSCSDSDSEGGDDQADRKSRTSFSPMQQQDQDLKYTNNHKDVFGHNNVDEVDDVIQGDSDLEDLHELEKQELRQRKAREESRRMRHQREAEIKDRMNQDEVREMQLEESFEEREPGCELFQSDAKNEAMAQLVKKKKERLDSQMRAKVSNKFLTQLFMFSLVNKAFIRQTLQEECLKAELVEDSDEEAPGDKVEKQQLQ